MSQNRYTPQMRLAQVGPQGQEKLRASRVLVVGAGGLGCPALIYLASAGIGHIGIIDGDGVSESNLHRQVLFTPQDVGKKKARCAQLALAHMNPDVQIQVWDEFLTFENAREIMRAFDVIIDGSDNFPTKYLVSDIAATLGKPVVYGSISEFEGRVCVFWHGKGPCYRCLYPQPPVSPIQNCESAGVLGAVCGAVGSLQALQAIKVLLDFQNPMETFIGRLCVINMLTLETTHFPVRQRMGCPSCESRALTQGDYTRRVCVTVNEISAPEAADRDDLAFLDVREDSEWNISHIKNAFHLPLSKINEPNALLSNLKSSKQTVVYCQSGKRSISAILFLKSKGLDNLLNLTGGLNQWSRKDKLECNFLTPFL